MRSRASAPSTAPTATAAACAGLSERFPDRRPGSAGDNRLAADDRARRCAGAGLSRAHRRRTTATRSTGAATLRTVIAERAGTIDERIVVVAHRDAAGTRAEAELSGTAALLELARIFGAPRQTRRTITLVSTSGGSGGAAGAARLRRRADGRPVGAVLVLGDLASRNVRAPLVTRLVQRARRDAAAPARDGPGGRAARDGLGLGRAAGAEPVRALRDAGDVRRAGRRCWRAGCRPCCCRSAATARRPPDAPISRDRLQSFGRAALRTVTVLDAAPAGAPDRRGGLQPRPADEPQDRARSGRCGCSPARCC